MTLLEVIDAIIDRMLIRPKMFAEDWATYDALLMHYFEMRTFARRLPPEAIELTSFESRALKDGLVVVRTDNDTNRVREYLEKRNQGNLHSAQMKLYERFTITRRAPEQSEILSEYQKLVDYVRQDEPPVAGGDEDDAVTVDFVASRLGVDAQHVLVTDKLICIDKEKLKT